MSRNFGQAIAGAENFDESEPHKIDRLRNTASNFPIFSEIKTITNAHIAGHLKPELT
jgi:hypothetical protein